MTEKTNQDPAKVYSGPERRTAPESWRKEVDRRFAEGSATMKALRDDLTENTAITKSLQSDTKELVNLLNSFKGAFKVLDMLGRLAKPLGYIAMAAGAVLGLWTAIKGGAPR